jgi:hypothetical protein
MRASLTSPAYPTALDAKAALRAQGYYPCAPAPDAPTTPWSNGRGKDLAIGQDSETGLWYIVAYPTAFPPPHDSEETNNEVDTIDDDSDDWLR